MSERKIALPKAAPIVVLKDIGKRGHNRLLLCRCACGKNFEALASNVRSGNTKSCGCHRSKVSAVMATTHGLTGTKIYLVWQNMMRRCYDKNNAAFHNYGGRGIKVCRRWHDFSAFHLDMGMPPVGMTLDRRDNSWNYSAKNCRWVTRKQQARNRRSNVFITIGGTTKTMCEWAEESGISEGTLWARKRELGWPDDRLIDPLRKDRLLAKECVVAYRA